LRKKDCSVGQSTPFGLISTPGTSAEDIEQHDHRKWGQWKCLAAKIERSKSMPLLQILLTLIVVGVLLWLVNRFIPMAGSIKSILNAVVVIGVVLWLLNVFGLFHSLSRIRVG